MAIITMQKVAIITHSDAREDVLDALQSAGVLEVCEMGQGTPVDHTTVEYREADVLHSIGVLEAVASKQALAASNKTVSEEEILKTATSTDVRGIVQQVRELEESDTNAEKEIHSAEQDIELLTPWQHYQFDLQTSRQTAHAQLLFGALPAANVGPAQVVLNGEAPSAELDLVSTVGDTGYCAVYLLNEDAEAVEAALTSHGWTTVELPTASGTASSQLEELQMQKKAAEAEQRKNLEARTKLSVELPKLKQVAQYLKWLDAKQHAREQLSSTEQTVTLFGWMAAGKVDALKEDLQAAHPAVEVLKIKADEDEEPPVALWNPKWIRPFHSVTELYGLPKHTEMDPTFVLSPFFILYFALCLTDAGYGAIIALVSGGLLLKTKQDIDEAPLVWLLLMGGIMTFIAGILFGGWLGFTPEQAPAIFTKETADGLMFKGQIWHLGKQSGITFLQNLSLFFGVTQVFFGIFLAGWYKWVHGRKAEALWQDFTSHMVLGAAIFYAAAPADLKQLGLYTVYGSIALLIWGKGYGNKWYVRPLFGFLGLLDFAMSMLSNILSYLRIMALGLVTGALAMAVNQMAVEMGKLLPAFLAIPVIILLFIGGHTVSVALNALGSFIHSARLQFIEFFSQFFEGGGRNFTPFNRST